MTSDLEIRIYDDISSQIRVDHPTWNRSRIIQSGEAKIEKRVRVLESIFEKHYTDEPKMFESVFQRSYTEGRPYTAPVKIAISGRPDLSAFLFSAGLSIEEVADILDLEKQTIEQYITDILHDRR